jgi:hypothetical protein
MPRTYPLEVILEDAMDDAIDQIVGEIEEASDNLRKYHSGEIRHIEDVDVPELLARHQAIALIWDADMVLSHCPQLTRDQAWQVLQECERRYTAEHGLTWNSIAAVVADLQRADRLRNREARVTRVARIIADYDPNGDERENLVDLLTDAMHWCEGFGKPFDEFCDTARMHFAAEANSCQKGA